jgi:hypothetical protein
MDTHHRNANPGSHPRQNPRRLGALNCKSRYGGAGIARSEPGDEMSCSGRAEPGDRDPSSFARAFWCSRNRTSRQMPKMALRAADFSTKCGLMCTIVCCRMSFVRFPRSNSAFGVCERYPIFRFIPLLGPARSAGPFSRSGYIWCRGETALFRDSCLRLR